MRQLVTVSGKSHFAITHCCSSTNGIWFYVLWVECVYTYSFYPSLLHVDTRSTDLVCLSFRKELCPTPIACHAHSVMLEAKGVCEF